MKLDLVDVFGTAALEGNPLAVVHGGNDLSTERMLQITRWLGFSETTFLVPPTDPKADYRVRIFYPGGELPFAGHPTLGSCFSWLAAGGTPKSDGVIVQECGVGLVDVKRDQDRLAFAAPPIAKGGPLSNEERARAAEFAGVPIDHIIEAVHANNGPAWQLLRLRSADDVLAANPQAKAPLGTDIGLAGPWGEGEEKQWELRAFFANQHGQLLEDPVTGSFNAGVAVHLFNTGLASQSYVAGQGAKVGADGRIHCSKDQDGTVWIAGRCEMISQGGEVRNLN